MSSRRLTAPLFLLVLSAPLAAQGPDSVVTLPSLVVTANRFATAREAVPSAVTVLDGADLRAQGVRFLADALREVPGLTVVPSGSFGSHTALFVRGGESDYVKVLIDGVPVNDPGGAVDLGQLTTDNVERIEIVRGPTSVLYGSDAVSGVVHIITAGGRGPTSGSARMLGGTYGALEADVHVAGGSETVSYALGVSRAVSDGILPFNNRHRNVSGSGTLEARPDERTRARLSVRYIDGVYHVPTDGAGNLVDHNAFRSQERTVTALELGRFLSPSVELIGLLALHQADVTNDDRPDDSADTLGFFESRDLQAVTRRSADARLNAYVPGEMVVTLGLAFEEQEERRLGKSVSQFGSSASASTAERRNWAPYAQVHAEPGARLALTAGARLDVNDAFGEFVTGRGAASYRLSGGTRVRVSAGTAFKEPTFFENFSDNPFARGNAELVPERSTSWEVGVEQRMAMGRVWVAATYFAQHFRDLIQYAFAPATPGSPNFSNVAKADAAGAELEVRAVPVRGLELGAGYTWTHTRVVDAGLDTDGLQFVADSALLRRPAHQAFARAAYRLGGAGQVSAQVRWTGERSDRDFSTFPAASVTLPAFATVDVASRIIVIRRTEGRPEVALQGRVTNLFDEAYQSVFGFAAPGRTILVGGSLGY